MAQLVAQRLAGGISADAFQGGLSDSCQRFFGEEGLVARHQDIGKCQQALEDVVVDDLTGKIVEEDARLLLIDIERNTAQPARLERLDQRGTVDRRTATGIDQNQIGPRCRQDAAIDQMAGLGRERAVQGDNIRFAKQVLALDIAHADCDERFVNDRIAGQDLTAEASPQGSSDKPANLSRSHDAGDTSVQVTADKAIEREIVLTNSGPCAVDLAIERQQETDREFGNRVRRVARHPHYGETERLGRHEIDIVIACAAQRDETHPAFGQHLEHLPVGDIVHKDAGDVKTARELRRRGRQGNVKEIEIEPIGRVRLGQELPVVFPRAKDRDAHVRLRARTCPREQRGWATALPAESLSRVSFEFYAFCRKRRNSVNHFLKWGRFKFLQFRLAMFPFLFCLRDQHDAPLVILAAIVCLLTAAATVRLCRQAAWTDTGSRSLLLAHSGELGLLIVGRSLDSALLSPAIGQPVLGAIAASMLVGPILAQWSDRAGDLILRSRDPLGAEIETAVRTTSQELKGHVVLAGCGPVGRLVALTLEASEIPYLAIERNVERLRRAQQDGHKAVFGDASRAGILKAAGVDRAAAIIVLVNNWHRSVRIIREAKRLNPAIHVIASLRDDAHLGELAQAGAAHVFPENYAAGLGLGAQALMTLGMSADDATDRIRAMRAQLSPDLQIVPR